VLIIIYKPYKPFNKSVKKERFIDVPGHSAEL
jgi:hypothetical protein